MGRTTVYSDHAIARMKSRNVTQVEVKLTLNNPDSTAPGRDGALNSWKEINGRVVRVTSFTTSTGVGKFKETTVHIITVAIQ